MNRKILSRVLMPVIAAFGLAACDSTPETSKVEKDGAVYTLHDIDRKGQKTVALHSFIDSTSTTYTFNKGVGYEAYQTKSYPGVNVVTGTLSGRSVIVPKTFSATADEADYKAKLAIGCELGRKTKSAPASKDERVETDRKKGVRFLEAYCN